MIALFDPLALMASSTGVEALAYLDLGGVIGGTSLRGIDIDREKGLLYVASRNPDALAVVDVSLRPDGTGPRNRVVGVQSLEAGPADVKLIKMDDGRDLLYVACITADVLYILEAATLRVHQVVRGIGNGPFDIAVYKRPVEEGSPARYLYVMVTNFEEGTVSVLVMDPVTQYHYRVARIGAVRSIRDDFK
jgi:hypothetical protein